MSVGKMVDLFSGLGGASEAFLKNDWEVERYDNNPLFWDRSSDDYVEKTVYWDALLSIPGSKDIDFLWASPPCLEFSNAPSAPKSMHKRLGRLEEYKPDMTLLKCTLRAIKKMKPRFWAIENVMGASPYFTKVIGKSHRVKVGSALIWGNFPVVGFTDEQTDYKKKAGDKYRNSPIRVNHRAKVPYWLSDQMRIAVQYQMMISDFEASLDDVSWAWRASKQG